MKFLKNLTIITLFVIALMTCSVKVFAANQVSCKSGGLEWKINHEKHITWDAANAWAGSLGSGWRLPSIRELKSLYKLGAGTRNVSLGCLDKALKGFNVWSSQRKTSSFSAKPWSSFYFRYNRGLAIYYFAQYEQVQAVAVRAAP